MGLVKCWEVFKCKEKGCPAFKAKDLKCWLFSETHCRDEIQGKFIEKIELCLDCDDFKTNNDIDAMKATLSVVNKQFKEYSNIIGERDKELESMSMELALSLSEVFEALNLKISSGDPKVRIPEESGIDKLIGKLKHLINLTAEEIGEIVDQSHEFAIVLAEHFDVLHKVSIGNLRARVSGTSQIELLESLKKVTNETIESIAREISKRKRSDTALQERENIGPLLDRLLALPYGLEVLVVDDGSPDGTGDLVAARAAADPRVHLLRRAGKLGLGSAYRDGFRYALERGAELVFEMDADFSHDPDSIGAFLYAVRDVDVELGSRYLDGKVTVVNWPLSRLILSYSANVYTRLITGMPIADATGGYKCFRRRALEAIRLDRVRSDGYAFQIEVSFKCWKRGFRIREIPIVFVDRRAGVSKMNRRIIWEAAGMVWRLRFMSLLGRWD